MLARREFTACDYICLANRLPTLLATAEATAALHPEPGAHQVLPHDFKAAFLVRTHTCAYFPFYRATLGQPPRCSTNG